MLLVELDDRSMHVTIPGVLRDPQPRELSPKRTGDLGEGGQKELIHDICGDCHERTHHEDGGFVVGSQAVDGIKERHVGGCA